MRLLQVSKYDPMWKTRFEQEKRELKSILGENVVDIQHIGSTSVPDMAAKPIIDVQIAVKELDRVDALSGELMNAGFDNLGEYGIEGRRYLRKIAKINENDWVSTVHVHIFQENDNENIGRHIAVREFLIAHPERAKEYGQLKGKLASECGNDTECYVIGKDSHVKKLERDALSWKRINCNLKGENP